MRVQETTRLGYFLQWILLIFDTILTLSRSKTVAHNNLSTWSREMVLAPSPYKNHWRRSSKLSTTWLFFHSCHLSVSTTRLTHSLSAHHSNSIVFNVHQYIFTHPYSSSLPHSDSSFCTFYMKKSCHIRLANLSSFAFRNLISARHEYKKTEREREIRWYRYIVHALYPCENTKIGEFVFLLR